MTATVTTHGTAGTLAYGVRISGGQRNYTDSTWATISDALERAAWLGYAYHQYGFVYTVVTLPALTKPVALVGRGGNPAWAAGGAYTGAMAVYIGAAMAAAGPLGAGWVGGVCPATIAPVAAKGVKGGSALLAAPAIYKTAPVYVGSVPTAPAPVAAPVAAPAPAPVALAPVGLGGLALPAAFMRAIRPTAPAPVAAPAPAPVAAPAPRAKRQRKTA